MSEQLSVNSAMVLPIGGPVIHSTECYVPTLAEGKKILEGIDPVVTRYHDLSLTPFLPNTLPSLSTLSLHVACMLNWQEC